MVATLARASVDGAVLVAAVWVISRLLRLSPATRTVLWWCAAAKFVLALVWTTPIAIPVLPAATTVRQEAGAAGARARVADVGAPNRGCQRPRASRSLPPRPNPGSVRHS